MEAATGNNKIPLGQQSIALGGGDRVRSEQEIADARVEEVGEQDIRKGESAKAKTTAAVAITATSIECEVESGPPAAANVSERSSTSAPGRVDGAWPHW